MLRIIAGVILLQTLYFKFTGHPESILLFTKLGLEPWGRIGTGVLELITIILLIVPATAFAGALFGSGLMIGAITSHLLALGIESNGDGGELFVLAIVVLLCCLVTLLLQKEQGIRHINRYFKRNA